MGSYVFRVTWCKGMIIQSCDVGVIFQCSHMAWWVFLLCLVERSHRILHSRILWILLLRALVWAWPMWLHRCLSFRWGGSGVWVLEWIHWRCSGFLCLGRCSVWLLRSNHWFLMPCWRGMMAVEPMRMIPVMPSERGCAFLLTRNEMIRRKSPRANTTDPVWNIHSGRFDSSGGK